MKDNEIVFQGWWAPIVGWIICPIIGALMVIIPVIIIENVTGIPLYLKSKSSEQSVSKQDFKYEYNQCPYQCSDGGINGSWESPVDPESP